MLSKIFMVTFLLSGHMTQQALAENNLAEVLSTASLPQRFHSMTEPSIVDSSCLLALGSNAKDKEAAPAANQAAPSLLTIEEYTTRLKEIRAESNKVIENYNRKKAAFEKDLLEKLNRLGNSPEDTAAKARLMDEAIAERSKMLEEYKQKIDLLKDREEALHLRRQGPPEELTPRQKASIQKDQLQRENESMKELTDRIRKQDAELQNENPARKEPPPKDNPLPKPPDLTTSKPVPAAAATPEKKEPAKKKGPRVLSTGRVKKNIY